MAQSSPEDFEYIATLKFASKLRYSTNHSPKEVMEKDYFKNAASNYLNGGDEIDVVCFNDDGSWTKGLLEVAFTDPTTTVVALIGKWRTSGGVTRQRILKAENKGLGRYEVKDAETGAIVASNLSHAEAAAMTGSTVKSRAKGKAAA